MGGGTILTRDMMLIIVAPEANRASKVLPRRKSLVLHMDIFNSLRMTINLCIIELTLLCFPFALVKAL